MNFGQKSPPVRRFPSLKTLYVVCYSSRRGSLLYGSPVGPLGKRRGRRETGSFRSIFPERDVNSQHLSSSRRKTSRYEKVLTAIWHYCHLWLITSAERDVASVYYIPIQEHRLSMSKSKWYSVVLYENVPEQNISHLWIVLRNEDIIFVIFELRDVIYWHFESHQYQLFHYIL